jgi:hypothetical protein
MFSSVSPVESDSKWRCKRIKKAGWAMLWTTWGEALAQLRDPAKRHANGG